jgi:hypothetical protein
MTSLAAVLALPGAECLAQGNSLFGSRGPTGGQAAFGGSSSFGRAGTSGYGTSSNRSAFGGASGFGGTSSFGGIQSGLGSTAGFGQGGQVQGSMLGLGQDTFGQASGLGQAMQPGGMVGRSNMGNFVGSGTAAQQQAFQQFGNFGQFNRGNTRTPNQGGGRNQMDQQRTVRPRQRVAFGYDPPTVAAVNAVVQTRIERLSTRRPELADVSLVLDGSGVARLRGAVPDAESARLAVAIVRLEPGVLTVENELVVQAN